MRVLQGALHVCIGSPALEGLKKGKFYEVIPYTEHDEWTVNDIPRPPSGGTRTMVYARRRFLVPIRPAVYDKYPRLVENSFKRLQEQRIVEQD